MFIKYVQRVSRIFITLFSIARLTNQKFQVFRIYTNFTLALPNVDGNAIVKRVHFACKLKTRSNL